MHYRWLHFQLPARSPPHHLQVQGWGSLRGEPHHPLLVAPPRSHPPARNAYRPPNPTPQKATTTPTGTVRLPATRPRPSHRGHPPHPRTTRQPIPTLRGSGRHIAQDLIRPPLICTHMVSGKPGTLPATRSPTSATNPSGKNNSSDSRRASNDHRRMSRIGSSVGCTANQASAPGR